jgi:hypothetical protein
MEAGERGLSRDERSSLKVQSSPFFTKYRESGGIHDLTGSPQITYFKVLFKRHTNFAIEPIAQTFSGTVRYGSKVTAVISRNGDLLGDMWLEAVLTRDTSRGATFFPGEQLVKSVELELGGQRVDKLYNSWYRVYDNLYRNTETDRSAYKSMVDFVDGETTGTKKRCFIPILFYCCRSPGNYLPLIALTLQRAKASCHVHKGSGHGKTTWAPFSYRQMLVDLPWGAGLKFCRELESSTSRRRQHVQIAGTP